MRLFDFFRKNRKQEETKEQLLKEEKVEQNNLDAQINKYRVKLDAGKKYSYDVLQKTDWSKPAAPVPEPQKETTETASISEPAKMQTEEKYTYRVSSVSEKDRWVFIQCNEEDATWDSEPFTELVKKAAGVMNDGVWEGNILSAGVFEGDTRYRIKNDPLFMVFQYDTLFGIVLEYTPAIGLEPALNYLSIMLNVEVDDKFRP